MFKNLIANIIGKFWNMISAIVFIPLYLNFLDFESFSIISFSVLLFSIILVFDSGMTASLSRELARADTDSNTKIITFDTLKTTYLFISIFVILIAFIFSKSIAINFVKSDFFSLEKLSFYIRIISIGIGFQMFLNFSIAGIIALNKQVLANKLLIFWSLFRNGFVVLILYFYPRLDMFFAWQTLSTIVFSIIALYYLTVFVKHKFEFNLYFDINNFKRIWRFTFGMFLLTLISVIVQQLDKLILSYLLPVTQLGYYSLAFTLSLFLVSSVNPFAITILPKLTAFFTNKKAKEAVKLFLRFQKITLIIIFSLSFNLMFFSYDFVCLWLGDEIIAKKVSVFLPLVLMGYTFMATSVMLYNVVIANGNTKLNLQLSPIFIMIIPLYFLFIKEYQLLGASFVFCVSQFIYIILYYYYVNKKYLNLNFKDLIIIPIGKPLLVSFILVGLFKYFKFNDDNIFNFFYISISIIFCFVLNIFVCYKKNNLKNFIKSTLHYAK